MKTTADYRRFNRWLIGILVSAVVLSAAYNIAIDPYGVWMTRRVAGINAQKPLMDEKGRLRIAWEVRRTRPRAIVFGTSTSKQLSYIEYGRVLREPACNAGVAMASLSEIRTMLDLALRQQPKVDHVLLALDFFQFNDLGYVNQAKDLSFTSVPIMASESASLLWSESGIRASSETLADNVKAPRSSKPPASGRATSTPPSRASATDATPIASTPPSPSGVDRVALFNKNLEMDMKQGGMYLPYRPSETAYDDLAAIVRTCDERGIDLQVMLTPIHARHMDELYSDGLGPEYDAWIRRVVEITPAWDFSGYNGFTTEPVTQDMKWYTDPLHYSLAAGTTMIKRVYVRPRESDVFGTRVTVSNLEPHLAELSRQHRDRSPTSTSSP